MNVSYNKYTVFRVNQNYTLNYGSNKHEPQYSQIWIHNFVSIGLNLTKIEKHTSNLIDPVHRETTTDQVAEKLVKCWSLSNKTKTVKITLRWSYTQICVVVIVVSRKAIL